MQSQLLQKDLTKVGEEISHELGAQMIKDYQLANPTDVKTLFMGREIIEQILAQPGCAGIGLSLGYDETGKKTLVSIGIDNTGAPLLDYTIVTPSGSMDQKKGIVADRLAVGGGSGGWLDWLTIFR